MVLKNLEVVNFRNLKPAKITFSPTINIFFGDNAQGKTNIIEAIYLLSFFKSFRAETDHELLQWDQPSARINGEFGPFTLSIEFKPQGKEIRLNNTYKRALEVLGELRVASFSPEDTLIVTGSPGLRRRFIDSLISSINRSYLYNLASLQKVLPNRNRVLQWLREGRNEDLAPWDLQLAQYSVPIWRQRAVVMAKLNTIVQPISRKLLGGNHLQINYLTQLPVTPQTTENELKESLAKELAKKRGEEIRRASTLVGPQRDDFTLLIEEEINNKIVAKDISLYGSRGEQRVGILILKLGELDLMEKEVGERPILLLDDVLSEFDQGHRLHLFSLLNKQQTFITTTDLNFFPAEVLQKAKLFQVKNGVCTTVAVSAV